MIPFLLNLANESGCRDADSLGEMLAESRPGSPSPVSKILDSNLVEEPVFLKSGSMLPWKTLAIMFTSAYTVLTAWWDTLWLNW